ncbi:hypothetical protein EDB84DRAFT_1454730 [Lactarius hengduanensis]|nr:hypothetical protein EDB85DRAFT_1891747 [Lactarius pseudohatsudake]KAH9048975.1 hypothetical protein EDB84DRAFT_1454730 [Lactarius hengduanensis]
MLRALSLRFTLKNITAPGMHRPVHRYSFRAFSTTPRWQADYINSINTSMFPKLADKPNALKAVSDFNSLYDEIGTQLGIDLNSTRPLSEYEISRLMADERLVWATVRMIEELNAVGLDMDPDEKLVEIPRWKPDWHKKGDS